VDENMSIQSANEQSEQRPMFTVGHSNQNMERFITLLKQHEVEVIVDVRSHPFSKYSTQFDHDAIKPALEKAAVKYLYLGKEKYQTDDGRADYVKLSKSQPFQSGITRLLNGNKRFRLALMCGEENPTSCHRRHLLGTNLLSYGIELKHIRGDGRLDLEEDLQAAENKAAEKKSGDKKVSDDGVQQLSLF
jgi:uncharacterized protein (DUF488 family)